MKYSSIPTAQSIVQHIQARGISNIIISPGSRNAPLTIAFTENPFFSCFSIVDERCAAFFAMGMAQQLQIPVVVICTSGSALLNYYPAVAEAYYSTIPLIVLSADRPSYKIDIGDGQTIRQENIYNNHVGYTANLKQDISHATEKVREYRPEWLEAETIKIAQQKVQLYNDKELNAALQVASSDSLPVHINVPLEEPLYDRLNQSSVVPIIALLDKIENTKPSFSKNRDIWNSTKRKMVLIGVSMPNTIKKETLALLANDPSVLVFTETTSNVYHPHFFSSIDTIIAPIELSENKNEIFEKLKPELLITFGGFIVSKKIKSFLRTFSPERHWHIGKVANDTFNCLEQHIKVSEDEFVRNMYEKNILVKSDYYRFWNTIKVEYLKKKERYLKQIPYSDFLVFSMILSKIPLGYQLQLANSSTVRYAQLFELDSSLKVFCNRGTSGIDGSTSTAIGASLIPKEPTLLITGDLSFFYDSNALWNNYIRNDFRIIVINNNGGGIFRILPGKDDSENFQRFFETKHNLTAEGLCNMYGFEYQAVDSTTNLDSAVEEFYEESGKPKILEVFTPRLINDKILIDYFRFIS